MRILLAIILLLCTGIAVAQAQTTKKGEGINSSPDVLAGTWLGDWDSQSRNSGKMEIEARMLNGEDLRGRMRATFINPTRCSISWENLTGVKKGEKFFAHYNLGGVCGKVEVIFVIEEKVMSGTWVNEHGRNGTFRLIKQQ